MLKPFGTEAGTPEPGEESGPASPRVVVVSAAISPGLAGVATISLSPPPSDAGVCRCGACLTLPRDIHWLD
jgi:hypothetical protein